MKRTFFRLLFAGIVIAAMASSFSPKTLPPQIIRSTLPATPAPMKPVTTNYIWFVDEFLTIPTGSICDVGAEIGRLNNLFPSNVFTTQFSTNVHVYEWGYAFFQPMAVIYSDM